MGQVAFKLVPLEGCRLCLCGGLSWPTLPLQWKHSPNLAPFRLTLPLSVITFLGAGRVSLRKTAVKAGLASVGPCRHSPPTFLSPDVSGFGWDEGSGRTGVVVSRSPGVTHLAAEQTGCSVMGASQEHMDGINQVFSQGQCFLIFTRSQTHLKN